ncbi:unnamed protein product (macronuclear) [Paramecium tetraurelia]|uniref:Uncharacterized protein n=1 Tax=Paramecium tetraurelia TaxID=5888 RepID=A0C9A0_PARTE|nr:uncharacterized protein GSPATT00006673001 [Paramecium tetraurelia]CAK67367.1 unnamed protein product [Paramecium tetraurelia]|eukprot:XP_001434764.1 hypothetical protein (macronuclear) [Paramecium tetraurelia strain d4-2]
MKFDEIIKKYVSPIKRFDHVLPNHYTAQDVYNYYEDLVIEIVKQAKFNEIESFTKIRFTRKFAEVAQTQDQMDWLNDRAKEISNVAMSLFKLRFPQQ